MGTRKNEWRKIGEDYWMAFLFDVYRENGVWYASSYCGSRFPQTFRSAKRAMSYCDNRLGRWW